MIRLGKIIKTNQGKIHNVQRSSGNTYAWGWSGMGWCFARGMGSDTSENKISKPLRRNSEKIGHSVYYKSSQLGAHACARQARALTANILSTSIPVHEKQVRT